MTNTNEYEKLCAELADLPESPWDFDFDVGEEDPTLVERAVSMAELVFGSEAA
jgi:hypothetical protein